MSLINFINIKKDNFNQFNEAKFKRFQELFPNANIQKVINAVPYFLSINNKKIPGYISNGYSCSISNYQPSQDTLKFIKSRFGVSDDLSDLENSEKIEMLAVMGSLGTIAYTKKSDFDYWVCVDRNKLSNDSIKRIQKKITELQKWIINDIKVEVHLFLNDINDIKNSIYAEDEDEAFGSTIGASLKDEFFRSSIIIAGKIPFWWVIPRIDDHEYEKLYNSLPESYKDDVFTDLGNINHISQEDYIGAALFQIIKAIESPFKSIIKIGVLEKYLFEPKNSPLLSQKVKSQIHQGKLTINILDSYILMFNEVYTFYSTILNDPELLLILRQNLYLKIDPQLSKYISMQKNKDLPYKVKVMFQFIKQWGWSLNAIKRLDNFDNWNYKEVMELWNNNKKFMLMAYQRISTKFPELNLADKISESDLTLLSRKIKTQFQYEQNKIDHYITFKDTPHQSILYIEPLNEGIDETGWKLIKRSISESGKTIPILINAENDLIKLLAWTSLNHIFNPTFSRLKIKSGYTRIDSNGVAEIMTGINSIFIQKKIPLKNDFYLKPAFNISNMIILNFNIENADSIKTIDFIYKTSWGESYLDNYRQETDITAILTKVLDDGLILSRPFDDYCMISSPESFKKLYKNMINLFKESYDFFVIKKQNISQRMITNIGDEYLIITKDNDKISTQSFTSPIQMLASLSLIPRGKIIYSFFGEDNIIQSLKTIYISKRRNTLSIFYEEYPAYSIIYLLNETGNIFTTIGTSKNRDNLLSFLYGFCRNVIIEINEQNILPDINSKIKVNKLSINNLGKIVISDETMFLEDIFFSKFNPKSGMDAIITKNDKRESFYTLNVGGNKIGEKMQTNILSKNIKIIKNKIKFFPLMNSIKFTNLNSEEIQSGTTIYFLEKNRLELLVNKK